MPGNILPAHSVAVPDGAVISQTPTPGVEVAPNTQVALTVSVGPMLGDANLDNRITLHDVNYILQIAAGATPRTRAPCIPPMWTRMKPSPVTMPMKSWGITEMAA